MTKKQGSKKGATKLPKRIGGVKLPKELRKAGGALIDRANSPKGREMIAAGLAMAASAASARSRPQSDAPPAPPIPPHPPETSARREPPQPARPGDPGTTDMPPEIGKVVDAFSAATTAFMEGFFGRKR